MGENNSLANRRTEKVGNTVINNNKKVLWEIGRSETPQCKLLILRKKKRSKICCQQDCSNFFPKLACKIHQEIHWRNTAMWYYHLPSSYFTWGMFQEANRTAQRHSITITLRKLFFLTYSIWFAFYYLLSYVKEKRSPIKVVICLWS